MSGRKRDLVTLSMRQLALQRNNATPHVLITLYLSYLSSISYLSLSIITSYSPLDKKFIVTLDGVKLIIHHKVCKYPRK